MTADLKRRIDRITNGGPGSGCKGSTCGRPALYSTLASKAKSATHSANGLSDQTWTERNAEDIASIHAEAHAQHMSAHDAHIAAKESAEKLGMALAANEHKEHALEHLRQAATHLKAQPREQPLERYDKGTWRKVGNNGGQIIDRYPNSGHSWQHVALEVVKPTQDSPKGDRIANAGTSEGAKKGWESRAQPSTTHRYSIKSYHDDGEKTESDYMEFPHVKDWLSKNKGVHSVHEWSPKGDWIGEVSKSKLSNDDGGSGAGGDSGGGAAPSSPLPTGRLASLSPSPMLGGFASGFEQGHKKKLKKELRNAAEKYNGYLPNSRHVTQKEIELAHHELPWPRPGLMENGATQTVRIKNGICKGKKVTFTFTQYRDFSENKNGKLKAKWENPIAVDDERFEP